MKKKVYVVASFLAASQAVASFAGVDVNINVGIPAAPPPVVVTQPAYAPPPPPGYGAPPEVVFEAQPRFIFSPTLGFYVTVGTPYDIVYIGSTYYFYSGGFWYAGPTYSGPWRIAKDRALPKLLRKYPYERIRFYRDQEYRIYQRDPARYRGRVYEPQWKRQEPRKIARPKEEPRREEARREEHRDEHREMEERR